MKKTIALIMSILLILSTAAACAETEETIFETMAGMQWSFLSGVGGWSTDLTIHPDGSFDGEFHDSEMGDSADEYPYGTVYGCTFSGQMTVVGQAENDAVRIRVEKLALDEGQAPMAIEDGVRYITQEKPYGISQGDEFLLYRPGTPVGVFTEEMLFWAHVTDRENPPAALDNWFLSNQDYDSGFVGYSASVANPWEEVTALELLEKTGLSFGVPEGAENVVYSCMAGGELTQMRFSLGADEFCARIQPVTLKDGELSDISGMYYDWTSVEPVSVKGCGGAISLAQDESIGWAELCLWYDAEAGLMYSLSVITPDADGLDLAAVAEQVYVSTQENI